MIINTIPRFPKYTGFFMNEKIGISFQLPWIGKYEISVVAWQFRREMKSIIYFPKICRLSLPYHYYCSHHFCLMYCPKHLSMNRKKVSCAFLHWIAVHVNENWLPHTIFRTTFHNITLAIELILVHTLTS